MENNQIVAVCPKLGDYAMIVGMLTERLTDCRVMQCPPITKLTVQTGSKYSPDTVCTPYKIITGSFIEALDMGANMLIMPAIGCRLGFYDILQERVLKDMGYKFKMFTLFDYTASASRLYKSYCTLNPALSLEQFNAVLDTVVRIVTDMDGLADYVRRNIAFECERGGFERLYKEYLEEAARAADALEAAETGQKFRERIHKVKVDKPEKPIRIGLIGDLYSVIEPHGNCGIEKWLAQNRVEIIRPVDLTYLAKTLFNLDPLIENCGGYIDYNLGGNAVNTVALACEMAKSGVDGIIHMKAATCTPEITAMTVLQNISKDFNVPVIYFTFDTETGDAGVHTRLEAFCDMLTMKREKEEG